MADLAGVVRAALVVIRERPGPSRSVTRSAILAIDNGMDNAGGVRRHRIGRLRPTIGCVAEGTVIITEFVGDCVAITANGVKSLEVGPLVTREATSISMSTH
jgi:hypothetical protein